MATRESLKNCDASAVMSYFRDCMPHVFNTIAKYVGDDICIDLYLETKDHRYLDYVPDLDLTFMKKGQLSNVVFCFGGGSEFMQFYRLQSAVALLTNKNMCAHVSQLLENIEKEQCLLLSQDVYCSKFCDQMYLYPEDFLSFKVKGWDSYADEYGVGGIIRRVDRLFFNYKDKCVITRIFFEIFDDSSVGRKIFPDVDEHESVSFTYVPLKSNVRLGGRKQQNPLLYRVYLNYNFQIRVRPYSKRPTLHHCPNGVYRSLKKIDFRSGFDDPRFRSKDNRIYIHVWPRVYCDEKNYYASFELSNELSPDMMHPVSSDDEYSELEEDEEDKKETKKEKSYPILSKMFTDLKEATAASFNTESLCSYNNTGRDDHRRYFGSWQFSIDNQYRYYYHGLYYWHKFAFDNKRLKMEMSEEYLKMEMGEEFAFDENRLKIYNIYQ